MNIVLATDAWAPQVNGVVRTLVEIVRRVEARGHRVAVISPDHCRTIACPGYREIRLATNPRAVVEAVMRDANPDIVHIATEGPIGWSARRWCIANGVAFTTAFHTRFPDYVALRTRLPAAWFWPIVRRFHAPARAVLAATPTLVAELCVRGFGNVQPWSRGVDLDSFGPDRMPHPALARLPRPILLSVGRVAIEKNLDAFLSAPVPGSKVVVGDGPLLATLRARYRGVHFLGSLRGEALAGAYAAADVFVFPSRTDTFGLVMLEALASGVPVAGYRVAGPLDVIGDDAAIGCLADRIEDAIAGALRADCMACVAAARAHGWSRCVDQFIATLATAATSDTAPVRMAMQPAG